MIPSMNAAREVADRALAHVLGDAELLATLLGATGARPEDLRAMLGSDALARACLDIVMEDDARVLAFARQAGLRPQDVAEAHARLAGLQG